MVLRAWRWSCSMLLVVLGLRPVAKAGAARSPRAAAPAAPPGRDPPPSDCGEEAAFAPTAFAGVDAADGVVFRTRLPALVASARSAVGELETAGGFANATHCAYFGCTTETKSTEAYLPCPSSRRLLAPRWLAGASALDPPLGDRGDGNALCRLATAAAELAGGAVLPALDASRHDAKCVVQELFATVQTKGGYTNPHAHADDLIGAVFYAETPETGATFCYDDGAGTDARARYERYDPALVRDLPGRRHVVAREGDLLLAPLGWLRHWVPPSPGGTRTVVVLNAVCL